MIMLTMSYINVANPKLHKIEAEQIIVLRFSFLYMESPILFRDRT